ncbi:hypothetical protein JHW43_001988 [Diplocarpon mali]|nr:hypothetical protein JHW43_001988 [Diplocarpon mali]
MESRRSYVSWPWAFAKGVIFVDGCSFIEPLASDQRTLDQLTRESLPETPEAGFTPNLAGIEASKEHGTPSSSASSNFLEVLAVRIAHGAGAGDIIALTGNAVTDMGGVTDSWSPCHGLVPLNLGFAGLLAFAPHELYVAKEPNIRFGIFGNWMTRLVYFQTSIHGIIFGVWCKTSRYALTLSKPPRLPSRRSPYSPGSHRSTGLNGAHCTEAWVFLNPVLGLAAGMLFAGMAIAVPAASKPINTAHVVAFFSFTRALGQCLGAAIGGTVFQNQIKDKLLQYPVLALTVNAYSQGAAGLVQVIKMIEGGVVKEHLMQAFADSLKVVRATMCGSAATALPSNVVMKGYSLDIKLKTGQGFQHRGAGTNTEKSKVDNEEKR